jgi:hypothetical protein
MKFDPYLLLTRQDKAVGEAASRFSIYLNQFKSQLAARDPAMEYKILTRINCHKAKYDSIFKSF